MVTQFKFIPEMIKKISAHKPHTLGDTGITQDCKKELKIKVIEKALTHLSTLSSHGVALTAHTAKDQIAFLVKTACEFNLLNELHALLELNLFDDINKQLQITSEQFNQFGGDGETLLGLAAFHGHYEIVSYLTEVRQANLYATNSQGNTALHQVVLGDYQPVSLWAYGEAHDRVADYLIKQGVIIFAKNKEGKTAHELASLVEPFAFEGLLGRRIYISYSGNYNADSVRPILAEAENTYLSRLKLGKGRSEQAKPFSQFCLEHGIENYVKTEKASFGFSNNASFFNHLQNAYPLLKPEIDSLVASLEPGPLVHRPGLIINQRALINKQSLSIGLMVTVLSYLATDNLNMAVGLGIVTAVAANVRLMERAIRLKEDERNLTSDRISHLYGPMFSPFHPRTVTFIERSDIQKISAVIKP